MQVFGVCMSCQVELGHPSFEAFMAPYYEDRLASVQCSRGHRSVLMLQSQKFEVLLESGANALTAGFTLEAAATFSAALERFIEFGVKVMLIHRGLHFELYDKMFKEMTRQSERQIGAFMALHALVLGSSYVPNKDIAPFRNSVIHKGQIPTPEEAKKFCANVYSEIHCTAGLLRENCDTAIEKVILEDLRVRHEKVPQGVRVSTTGILGLYSLASKVNKADFEQALSAYVKSRDSLAQALPHFSEMHAKLFPQHD